MSEPEPGGEEKQILKVFEADEFKSIIATERNNILQAAVEELFKKIDELTSGSLVVILSHDKDMRLKKAFVIKN